MKTLHMATSLFQHLTTSVGNSAVFNRQDRYMDRTAMRMRYLQRAIYKQYANVMFHKPKRPLVKMSELIICHHYGASEQGP